MRSTRVGRQARAPSHRRRRRRAVEHLPGALETVPFASLLDHANGARPARRRRLLGHRRDPFHLGHLGPVEGRDPPARAPAPAFGAEPRAARPPHGRHVHDRAAALPHQCPDERLQRAPRRGERPRRAALLGLVVARSRAGVQGDAHDAARRHARVHPQAAAPGRRTPTRCSARAWSVPCPPDLARCLPRPLRPRGGRHLLREHRGRHGRPAHARRTAGLGRPRRPGSLRDPRRRRRTRRTSTPGEVGELLVRSAASLDDDAGLLRDARAHARGVSQPLVPHRRRRAARRRREPVVRRPDQGPDPAARGEHRLGRRRDASCSSTPAWPMPP